MLCLSRKVGESIKIGEAVLTVLDSRAGIIRFGIVADRSIPVDRIEVWERKEAERAALAARPAETDLQGA